MVTDFFQPFEIGGAEVSVRALASLLIQEGVGLEILSGYPAESGEPVSQLPFPVHYVPFLPCSNPLLGIWEEGFFSPMRMSQRLAELLASRHFDILHAHNKISAIAVLMAKRSRVSLPPSVLTMRSYCHICPLGHGLRMDSTGLLRCDILDVARCVWRQGPPGFKKTLGLLPFASSSLLLHRLSRDSVECFDRYICISSIVRKAVEANLDVDPKLVSTIPEFLNMAHLTAAVETNSGQGTARNILYVGRLVREKGLLTLLEAFRIVAEEEESASLTIVGDGPMRTEIGAWVRAHGLADRIAIAGFVDHGLVARYFALAEVVVVPSQWPEPLGIVVLEALQMGKAVIATSHGGILDIVRHESNGLLVPPSDVPALAHDILRLLQHPELRERFRKAGPATIAERFAPAELVRRTIGIYRELANCPLQAWDEV